MEELIKFRTFAAKMSHDEFESIAPKITEIIGKDELISSLFNHFKHNVNDETTRAKIMKINQQISNNTNACILALRESPEIDKMSESLINKIATYLDITSYSRFERCNRAIFIAARSPYQPAKDSRSLHHLGCCTHDYLSHCTKNNIPIDRSKFSRMQYLDFKSHMGDLLFDKLKQLEIDFSDVFQTFESSLNSNNINLSNLLTLIISYQSLHNDFFNAFLPKAINLQILQLHYEEAPAIHSVNFGIFKKLKGLSLTYAHDWSHDWNNGSLVPENAILDLCSSQLISFFTDSDLTRLNVDYKRFPNLQELYLRNNWNEKIIEKIKEFKHLQKIHLDLVDWINDSQVSIIPLTTTFINTLFCLHELEVVEFDICAQELSKLMKLIQNALMIHEKKKLKIKIFCRFDAESTNKDMCIDFEVFVNSLSHICKDFMFRFDQDDMKHYLPQNEVDAFHKWMDNINPKLFWVEKDANSCGAYFVVANKGCKINGYRKRWFMKYD